MPKCRFGKAVAAKKMHKTARDLPGGFRLSKKVLAVMSACKSLAEFHHPQMTEENETAFFPRTCASEKTLFRPQVCEQRECAPRTASFLIFSEMLAFLRERVEFLDTLKRLPFLAEVALLLKD